MSIKKFIAFIASVFIGVGITSTLLWLFAIEVSPLERWMAFPDGWRIMDLIMNAVAVLMLFGTVRAAYGVLYEVWIRGAIKADDSGETRSDVS